MDKQLTFESPSHSETRQPWDPHIPFSAHINELPRFPLVENASFHPYLRLPLELQLYILELSGHQMLFKVMQACPTLRSYARQLFWSDRNVWYYVLDNDLLWHGSSITKPMCAEDRCSLFAAQIESVELVLDPSSDLGWSQILQLPYHDGRNYITETAAALFVTRFLILYPSAKRVVIIDNQRRFLTAGNDPPVDRRPEAIATIAYAFPSHITVYRSDLVATPNGPLPFERTRHQLCGSKRWALVDEHWIRRRVLIPRLKIQGIVGEYLRAEAFPYFFENILGRQNALFCLTAEILERYHFGGPVVIPFQCPSLSCRRTPEFMKAGDCMKHWHYHDYQIITTIDQLYLPPTLPSELRNLLMSRLIDLLEVKKQNRLLKLRLRDEWGEPGSAKHRQYEAAFLNQLVEDPLLQWPGYDKGPRKHFIWYQLSDQWADHWESGRANLDWYDETTTVLDH